MAGWDDYPAVKADEPPEQEGALTSVGRVLKQVPLGVARGLQSMAHLGEAQLETENLTDRPAPKVSDFAPAVDEIIGGENKPRNIYEKMASGAGEALPFAVGTGTMSPIGLGIQAFSGATGAAGQEAQENLFPELGGHWGNALGSIVGALGASKVANAISRMASPRPQEFGIPITRGQRTGEGLAEEEAIRKGGKGVLPQKIMERFDSRQQAAAANAVEDTRGGLGGAPATTEEAGSAIDTGLKSKARGYQQGADDFYESAANKKAWVEDIGELAAETRKRLRIEGFDPDNPAFAVNNPSTSRALKLIDKISDFNETKNPPGIISTQEMEKTRRALRQMFPAKGEDRISMKHVKDVYDEWERDIVTNHLIAGDKTALNDLEKARELWKNYKDMTSRTKGADKVIASIVNGEHSPEQVANFVVGTTSIGGGSASANVLRKIKEIFPSGSPEFESLRQAVFNKLTVDPLKKEGLSPQRTATALRKFVNGEAGRPVAQELFSQEERATMMRLADRLEKTAPKMANPSGSGTMIAQLMMPTLQAMGSAGAFALAQITGDKRAYVLMALPWIGTANAVRKALSATRDVMPARTSGIANVGAAGLRGAVQQQDSE